MQQSATTNYSRLNVIVIFTKGMSLAAWDTIGILEREIAVYRELRKRGVEVVFLTYGGRNELKYAARMHGIGIVCNSWNLPEDLYYRMACFIHWRVLRHADILKTNQMKGSDVAVCAARLWRKPLVARCGYLWSEFEERAYGACSREANEARRMEAKAFRCASQCVVTTEDAKQVLIRNYGIEGEKITVIPNYVDFSALGDGGNSVPPSRGDMSLSMSGCNDSSSQVRIGAKTSTGTSAGPFAEAVATAGAPVAASGCFVGRLAEQKNLAALIAASEGLNLRLVLVGEGSLHNELATLAQAHQVNVQFLGNVPHSQIAGILRQNAFFVLPSLYEGHPKTLIEAMACGMPVIGTDVPGIREVIRHEETGLLCGTDPVSLRAAIVRMMGDPALRERLGRNARQFAVEHYSLDRIVEMELAVYRKVMGGGKGTVDIRH